MTSISSGLGARLSKLKAAVDDFGVATKPNTMSASTWIESSSLHLYNIYDNNSAMPIDSFWKLLAPYPLPQFS
jgi:hypothetical protein